MNTLTLLPDPTRFRLEYIACAVNPITLIVTSLQTSVCCPLCGCASTRVHSRYQRTLADMPWNQIAIRLHLGVRKFFCANALCRRLVFTEPLPGFAARYARKTLRLNEALYLLGYALGGEAGARVAVGLGLNTSPDTLLNRIRQAADVPAGEAEHEVSVLGVDDFAFRKGHRYGTILIDLVRRRVLDLLPDRTADSLATWLRAHPSVKIVSRDRASAYAEGAKAGAPQAKQVADRWHLLKNATDMLERLLTRHHKPVREAARQAASRLPDREPEASPAAPSSAAPDRTRLPQDSAHRHERRLERYRRVMELQQQGQSLREIARKTGLARNTLRKWLVAGDLPAPARRSVCSPGKLAPFIAFSRSVGRRAVTARFNSAKNSRRRVSPAVLLWCSDRCSPGEKQQESRRVLTAKSRRHRAR